MTYENKEMLEYLKWIRTLAFRATEENITAKDMKTLWVFINRATNYINRVPGHYISRSNTLLKNAESIINERLAVKTTDIPKLMEEYDPDECKAIKKAVTRLHKKYKGQEESRVWKFCQRFRFYESGNRNNHTPSAKKLNHGKMMVAAYG